MRRALEQWRRWRFQRLCEQRPERLGIERGVRVIRHPQSSLRLGDGVKLSRGVEFWLAQPSAVIEVGGGVFVNWGTKFIAEERISIGAGSAIAWNVVILDSDWHVIDDGPPTAPVEIGEHVLIGANAMVLKGVRVGDGAVIAAGSVVSRDVPPRTLVAGVPASVRKENVSWQ